MMNGEINIFPSIRIIKPIKLSSSNQTVKEQSSIIYPLVESGNSHTHTHNIPSQCRLSDSGPSVREPTLATTQQTHMVQSPYSPAVLLFLHKVLKWRVCQHHC